MELYSTTGSHRSLFHVKHAHAVRQPLEISPQRCDPQLRSGALYDLHQSREIFAVQLRSGIVEQERRSAWFFLFLNFELSQHQPGRHKFLLAARNVILGCSAANLNHDVAAMWPELRRPVAAIAAPI